MNAIRYTLLSDGSSDKTLLPVITWLLYQHCPQHPVYPQWADLRRLVPPPQGLPEKVRATMRLYPCDLLFVHRDAERVPQNKRVDQIRQAEHDSGIATVAVPLVPVRMTEAWFLFDEHAIRRAAGNPNGNVPLQFPPNPEELPDPKARLHALLKTASELSGRRLRKFREATAVHRVAELIQDFSPLRSLPAFNAFEDELRRALSSFQCANQET